MWLAKPKVMNFISPFRLKIIKKDIFYLKNAKKPSKLRVFTYTNVMSYASAAADADSNTTCPL
jgi:hypothetical protein